MLLEDRDRLSRKFNKEVVKVDYKEICTLWAGYGRIFEVQVYFSSSERYNVINKVNNITTAFDISILSLYYLLSRR